jgi:hypothetical protein
LKLVELEMIRLSAALRSKPSWWTKFRDDTILAKWRAEALEQAELMKEPHVDYVLKELDGYANLRDEKTGSEVRKTSLYSELFEIQHGRLRWHARTKSGSLIR